MTDILPFHLFSGSITGFDHTNSHLNNQDALCIVQEPKGIIAIVCDGGGKPYGEHSEVGAKLGLNYLQKVSAKS